MIIALLWWPRISERHLCDRRETGARKGPLELRVVTEMETGLRSCFNVDPWHKEA